ncbi:DUF3857 domain-containing protein [Flavobacterium sufflavum]|uniref:DUF3857 domain-containing protein n=1 Tax=Flavobacterium sufflavum TaxID=1921138 RepID=A0A437KKF2_9FLAO|nr:DUF3857 domain-containing protein [Flavobacterium sufflavum]RVT71352.1 DUF3857 domain-containing protein [Flavobacterium sufflavum]
MNRINLKPILTLLLLANVAINFAQDFSFKNYDWQEKPIMTEIPALYKDSKEVILDRTIKIEIIVTGNTAKQYHLNHEKIFINSDEAIERNNKIYISFGNNENILTNKVRVILKNGNIITLNPEDIKEEVDKERGVKYNYFAVNGLEKGAIIEKLYIIEENPDLKGNTVKMQSEFPISNLSFELIYPKNLIFKTKSYNGLSNPVLNDSLIEGKTKLTLNEQNIAALNDDEKYSNWDVKIKLFRYKLEGNNNNGAKNLYNYKEFATNVHNRINVILDKKQQKSIDDFCATITKSSDEQEQIWNIENRIKKTITLEKFIDSKESLTDVIKSKQANEVDILKLYKAVLKNFKIENHIVFTSSRYKIPFDVDFESYENLNDFLIYFPSIKKYLSPKEIEFRIPLFPKYLGNNYGLFIKEKEFAGVSMAISEVNFIEIPGNDISHDYMDIIVDFTKDISNPFISSKLSFGGYSGLNMQPIKDFYPAEQYQTILKNIAENYTVKTEYKTLNASNDGIENIGKKPFVLDLTFEGKDLIQMAGDKYLFSVGQIIGRQMEFYQENKRVLPVEIDYPHFYTRKIKIILPKNTTIQNLEKFNMDFKTIINNKPEAAFISKYNKENNEIVIENSEYYNIINYPLASFEDYKAVINAAADFNKIVVILSN